MLQKLKILFVSAGDSCRSQMARGWTRHLKANLIECDSAGVENHTWNTYAVGVMAEAGVDIAKYHSKTLQEVSGEQFDYVIALCEQAYEVLMQPNPDHEELLGKAQVLRFVFDDPTTLAGREKNSVKALDQYRRIRDDVKAFVMELPDVLQA